MQELKTRFSAAKEFENTNWKKLIIPKLQTCQKTLSHRRIKIILSIISRKQNTKTNSIKSIPLSKQITPPSWLSLQVTQPQFKNGAATPASHRCRLQRVPKNYSPSIEGVAFSTIPPPSPPSSRVHRERERENEKLQSVSTATCHKAGHDRTHVLGIRFAGT